MEVFLDPTRWGRQMQPERKTSKAPFLTCIFGSGQVADSTVKCNCKCLANPMELSKNEPPLNSSEKEESCYIANTNGGGGVNLEVFTLPVLCGRFQGETLHCAITWSVHTTLTCIFLLTFMLPTYGNCMHGHHSEQPIRPVHSRRTLQPWQSVKSHASSASQDKTSELSCGKYFFIMLLISYPKKSYQ